MCNRKKLRSILVAGLGIVVLLSGCDRDGKQQTTELPTETKQESEALPTDIAQYRDEKAWKEDVTITNANGDEVELLIRARVIVPENVDEMSVIEVSVPELDTDYVREIISKTFGNAGVTYHTGMPVDEKLRGEEFNGNYQGEEWKLTVSSSLMEETKQGSQYLSFHRIKGSLNYNTIHKSNVVNESSLSQKEAVELAQNFIRQFGLEYQEVGKIDNIRWTSDKKDLGNPNGYAINFHTVPTDESEQNYSFIGYDRMNQYSMENVATVCIKDDKVIGMSISNPLKIESVVRGVNLLPLDTIKEILLDELVNHTDECWKIEGNDRDGMIMNKLELIYFRVPDKEAKGHFSYIPAWRLSKTASIQDQVSHPIIVNAIDGSFINLDEAWEL